MEYEFKLLLGTVESAKIGKRLLLLPGAAALWPYVLYRWHGARRQAGEHSMTRSHGTVHRVLWPALALLVTLGLTMWLALRPP